MSGLIQILPPDSTESRETQRDTQIYPLVYHPDTYNSKGWAGLNPEPRTEPKSLRLEDWP